MTLFRLMCFRDCGAVSMVAAIVFFAFVRVFALQIEAPPEIYSQVKEYADEAGALPDSAATGGGGASGAMGGTAAGRGVAAGGDILRVELKNNGGGIIFELSLIGNGKVLKKIETSEYEADSPNLALQNAVLEILGKTEGRKSETPLSNGLRAAIAGAGIAALWAVLYLTEQPKVVDLGQHYKIEVKE